MNIGNCIAIGDNISLKTPFVAQDIPEQRPVYRAGHIIQRIVGIHDRIDMRVLNTGFKCRQVIFPQASFINVRGNPVTAGIHIVTGKVFYRGNCFQVLWIVSLHAPDEILCKPGCQERILAIRFLCPAPPGIS